MPDIAALLCVVLLIGHSRSRILLHDSCQHDQVNITHLIEVLLLLSAGARALEPRPSIIDHAPVGSRGLEPHRTEPVMHVPLQFVPAVCGLLRRRFHLGYVGLRCDLGSTPRLSSQLLVGWLYSFHHPRYWFGARRSSPGKPNRGRISDAGISLARASLRRIGIRQVARSAWPPALG